MKLLWSIMIILILLLQVRLWIGEGSFAQVYNNQTALGQQAELHSRKSDQMDSGVHHRPSRSRDGYRLVTNRGSSELWHHRTGCTSQRILEATEPCVTGMELSDHKACNCRACRLNGSLRPDHAKPSEPKIMKLMTQRLPTSM